MKIQWLGHACFSISLQDGRTIITDPFDQSVGYPQPNLPADIVTVSHQHFDHNAVKTIPGNPAVVHKEGRHSFGEINITGIPSFHDSSGGSERGKNLIFVIEAEGLRICHLGDLGHILDDGQTVQIGNVDILMVPVGGFYTIGPDDAAKVVDQIRPRLVLPMHYKTRYLDFPIVGAEEFLKKYPGHRVERELDATPENLPGERQVVLLELKR
ncbi:MAG: MBL fold metallo-hydrolase [Peptococcaceae bacterium]|nr:MBL fold metallo-hydrolase [Peptococcaceae bacterium]